MVVLDSSFGYLYLKFKGDAALLSGYLNEIIFSSDEMVDAAIEFVVELAPQSKNLYMPYHISRVRETSFVEYNGEY
ncbi:hypothetical protein D3C73_1098930 [compost metagenome]